MGFALDNWMVAWNPNRPGLAEVWDGLPDGTAKVGLWPDETGWSDNYLSTSGCCNTERSGWEIEAKVMMMFIDFHTLIVGGNVDPQLLHKEFLKIDEYRYRIARDIQGAADRDEG